MIDFMARDRHVVRRRTRSEIAAITDAYNAALVERAGTDLVPILVAHFMVNGRARLAQRARTAHRRRVHRDRTGDPRGTAVRRPRPHPRAAARPGRAGPAAYAGSLLAAGLRRGGRDQAGRRRRRRARAGSRPCGRSRSMPGRPLEQVRGTWDEIAARADELADRYLDLTVAVGGPDPGARSSRRGAVPLPGAGARRAAGQPRRERSPERAAARRRAVRRVRAGDDGRGTRRRTSSSSSATTMEEVADAPA